MNISGRAGALFRRAALTAAFGMAVMGIGFAALGFLIAGFYIWLAHRLGAAPAAALTGGVLIFIALLAGLTGRAVIKRVKSPPQSLLAEFSGTLGMAARLVGVLVRRDPKKALVLSIIAGALAEYIAGGRQDKSK